MRCPDLPIAVVLLALVLLLSPACERRRYVDFFEYDIPTWDPGDTPGNFGSGYYAYGGDVNTAPLPDLITEVSTPDIVFTVPDAEADVEPPEVVIPTDPVIQDCVTHLVYQGVATSVALAAEFNGFSATANPFQQGTDGVWHLDLTLAPGEYAYKLVVNTNDWQLDPANPYTKYNSNILNSNLRVADCEAPGLKVIAASATKAGALSGSIQFVRAANLTDTALDPATVVVTVGGQTVQATVDAQNEVISVTLEGLPQGKHTIRVMASDKGGRAAPLVFMPLWVEAEPFSWTDGAMYFVFTDRFYNGDTGNDVPVDGVLQPANYQGGDFQGVIDKLKAGYFEALGVRSLWLSPVYDNPQDKGYIGADNRYYSGYHGYWPAGPLTVEEHFGSEATLKALVDEAHKRGIRVIFDLVLNHTHSNSPYFQQHQNSAWFNGNGDCVCGQGSCDWNAFAETCWFAGYTPDLNYRHHAVVQQLTEDTLEWIRRFDVDGLRLDAVKHMPDVISQTISLRIRDAFETFGPRFYLVGETFAGGGEHDLINRFIGPHQLDGQYDFTLLWPILDTFARDGNFNALETALAKSEQVYKDALMSPFLGNHDIERFISMACRSEIGCHEAGRLQGNTKEQAWTSPPQPPNIEEPYRRIALGFAFLLTLPGVPLIYYGDEIGLPGAHDPDNRRMMRFGAELSTFEQNTLALVQKIGQARAKYRALRRGSRAMLHLSADTYAYARYSAAGDAVIIVLNRSSTSKTFNISIPAGLAIDGKTMVDQLSGAELTVQANQLQISGIGGWTAMILAPK